MGYAVYTGPRRVSAKPPKYRAYLCDGAQHLNADGSTVVFRAPAALERRTPEDWKFYCPECAAKIER